jgi:hypothetical protein
MNRLAWRGPLFDATAVLGAVAVRLWNPGPRFIETHYSNGVYPAIDRAVRAVTGPPPFCLGDVLAIVALAALGGYWFRMLRSARSALARKPSRIGALLRAVSRTLAGLALVYLWFMVSWAFGYARVPLTDKIVVHESRTDEDSVNRLADRVIDELTRDAPPAHAEHLDDAAAAARLQPRFEATIRRLGDAATFAPPRLKPTLFQPLFRASATTGFTDPWTHEVNLDASLFAVERPAIFAHEWSHLAGFNDESEANFIAVIACTTATDPLLRYSGWLLVWSNLPHNVRPTHRIGRLAYEDLAAIRARYLKNVNRQVEHASRAAYNGYLKSNHVKAGYASYGIFIRWLTGADFDRGGLPVVREAGARPPDLPAEVGAAKPPDLSAEVGAAKPPDLPR